MTRKIPIAERLDARTEIVTESGCWLWTGYTNPKGYGYIGKNPFTKEVTVHRARWELVHGPIPGGVHILHRCDVPCCSNPDHLFAGSNQDNVDDKMNKGRHKPNKGINHGMAVLADEQVLDIRRRYSDGERQVDLADHFGVTRQQVYVIVHRKQWKHI